MRMRSVRTIQLLLLAIGSLLASFATAQAGPPPPPTNILFGFINFSRTLTYAYPGPDYYVPGDVVVGSGATLTIEPGVTLHFTANQDTLGGGDFPNLAELDVRGSLIADATLGDSIRFVSTSSGMDQWGQIKLEGGAASTLRRVSIQGADIGVQALSPCDIENCQMSAANTGLILRSSGIVMKRCLVADAINGVDASTGSAIMQECILVGRGNSGAGLQVGFGLSTAVADSTDPRPTIVSRYSVGVQVNGGARVEHVIAHHNSIGFQAQCCGSSWSAVYCTAAANSGYGINFGGQSLQIFMCIAASNGNTGILYGASPPCSGSGMDYTDSWSNGAVNYSLGSCAAGLHRDSFNPFFVNAAGNDYHLSSGSVFKTYGPWGAEIGAYGPGPGAPTPATVTSWGKVKATYR